MPPKPKSGKKPSKSQFIRSQPASMKAKDVVAAARKLGLSFGENYVYTIRGNVKRRAARKGGRGAATPPVKRRRGEPSKSAYILSQPRSVPAKALVVEAKKRGMTLTEHYIYKVRATKLPPGPLSRGQSGGNGSAAAAARVSARAGGGGPLASGGTPKDERDFRALVIEIGVQRARELIAEVEGQLAAIIAGS